MMEIQKLVRFNNWWKTGDVPGDLLEGYRRPLYDEILKYLGDRQTLAVVGLRRVGKTTLMYQLIQYLLEEIERKCVFYFSFDEEPFDIEEVLETYRELILRRGWRELDRVYIFLDEVQKVEGWQDKIKIYYDLYPNLKFIVSGSASLIIEKKAKESLAGRLYDFHLDPLTFREFLSFKKIFFENFNCSELKLQDIKRFDVPDVKYDLFDSFERIEKDYDKLVLFESELRTFFNEYLFKGGFPEVVGEDDEGKVKRYIKNSVVDKVVYVDIPRAFRIEEPEVLMILLRMIANTPGLLIDYNTLANNLGKNRKTISNYLYYLRKSFLVLFVSNFSGSSLASARKLKKAYLTDTGIANALMDREIDGRIIGMLVENLVVSKLKPDFFWKRNYEVDMILARGKKVLPVEIKYQGRIGKRDLRGMFAFCRRFKSERGIVVTKDLFKKERINDVEILFIPAWLFLLINE